MTYPLDYAFSANRRHPHTIPISPKIDRLLTFIVALAARKPSIAWKIRMAMWFQKVHPPRAESNLLLSPYQCIEAVVPYKTPEYWQCEFAYTKASRILGTGFEGALELAKGEVGDLICGFEQVKLKGYHIWVEPEEPSVQMSLSVAGRLFGQVHLMLPHHHIHCRDCTGQWYTLYQNGLGEISHYELGAPSVDEPLKTVYDFLG